jgi:parvulin-like peptidyl-prolyl isomerase
MSIGSPHKNEVPVPPGFETCIAHLQASKRSGTASELQLKEACQEKYEILLEQSLSGLINEAWLINEAKAERISVDEAALARELKASRALFEKFGGFQKGLARNGRTPMDLKSELRLGQLSNQIYEHIEAKIPHLSESFVSEYYKAHKDQYKLPVRRDLRIVRTSSGAAAHHAKQQIRSGKSFAEVVKHLTVAQPFSAKEGFVKGLTHKLYAEPLLADAIFKAPLHVLSGPVKIPLGYYLFEVTRQIPAHQLTLAEATPQIKDQLPRVLHDQTLSGFVKAFKRKWALRTNCRAGYMVQGCREFKATEATVPSDPFVL